MAMTWKDVENPDTDVLKPGDRVRYWYRGGSNIVFETLNKPLLKRALERDPRVNVTSIEHVERDKKDYMVCEVLIVEPPLEQLQTADISGVLVVASVGLMAVAIMPLVLTYTQKAIDQAVEATWKILVPLVIGAVVILWVLNQRGHR